MLSRRHLLGAGLAWPLASAWAADADVATLLREGGVVMAFRHALAPGTFDPPGFKLGECAHAAQPERRRAGAGAAHR